MPSILDLANREAAKAALDQVAKEKGGEVALEATATGIEASVSTTKKGWAVTAYAKKLWHGRGVEAGARVSKKL
jgi:hypothetical protein